MRRPGAPARRGVRPTIHLRRGRRGSEILTFRRGQAKTAEDVTLVAPSSLVPSGARLWDDSRLDELASLLFLVHDHFAAAVYPTIAPLQLDVEIDVTMDGRTVVKQARPYISLGP